MKIRNSKLFKSFVRPVLEQHHAADGPDSAKKPGIVNSLVQSLINCAKLEVSLISITNATKDSFSMSIEGRITVTGAMSSTISPVEFDIMFNGSSFGKLMFPETKTGFWGADVSIKDQEVKILDMTIFKAYIRSVIVDEDICFQLNNGKCIVTSL
ncbi:hypothetical protein PT974_02432 [Cladobotryum mycophilum]|uniref:Uncharacterized protein n=1 Tax=Cladobotryum mycophilum TaxID=491253 RepID=A0ABR0SZ85_9HYPO